MAYHERSSVREEWRGQPSLSSQRTKGTPQGSPLSPLLSNIVLDELDKELERRGLKFVRYADDMIIMLRSQKAAERVMESVTEYIEGDEAQSE